MTFKTCEHNITCNSYSIGKSDLPDIYARGRGPLGPSAYKSGKSRAPMLQLLYSTWVTHLQVLVCRIISRVYLYWPLLTSIVGSDVRATNDP